MNTTSLLVKLNQLGVELAIKNNQLVVHSKDNLSPETIQMLAIHKDSLISKLHEINNSVAIAALPIEKIMTNSSEFFMSIGQERFWCIHQLLGVNCLYNQQSELRISGKLDREILTSSFMEIVRRHSILRTTFTQNSMGTPLQIINDIQKLEIPVIDISEEYATEKLIDQLALEEGQKVFDLSKDFLLRLCILCLSEQEHILLLTMHHAITDGWSFSVFFKELWANYQSIFTHKLIPKNELSIQYIDFAYWQKSLLMSELFEKQREYWKNQLAGLTPMLNLPYSYAKPLSKKYVGKIERFNFSTLFTNQLEELSLNMGVILPMTLLAAFKVLLLRYSAQTDIAIGIPVAYRHHPQVVDLIGFFVNTIVLRSDLSANKTFEELLKEIKKTSIEGYANQDLPFDEVVKILRPDRTKNSSPLFQIMFVFQNTSIKECELSGLRISQLTERRVGMAKFDLNLSIKETLQGLEGFLEYSTELFNGFTIKKMLVHYKNILKAVVNNPKLTLAMIPLITATEKKQLIIKYNKNNTYDQFNKGIHQLIEEQVKKTPNAIAIVYNQQQLTYQELNQKANQLAHYIQSLMLGLEVKVGLYIEKSLGFMVGLLGILKAGAAYVPLDVEYPEQRLQFMIIDAKLSIIITHSKFVKNITSKIKNIICLDVDWPIIEKKSTNDLENIIFSAQTLAYIMYTSGSTGIPKGVMVKHQGLCNLAKSCQKRFLINSESKVLQFASISFDVAISDIILALTHGAALYLANKESAYLGQSLASFIIENAITHIHLTPSTLSTLPIDKYPDLKCIIVGGEPFSITLVERWAARRYFFNSYGATETSVTVALAQFEADSKQVLIGKPINNTQIYILDANNKPVPKGVIGEICVVGASVAAGYWNQQKLTAEKFIANPFSFNDEDSIMYKTGDLGRYLSCGNLEFVGRIDRQIKVRGYRIDPLEIEIILNEHPAINSSVVILYEKTSNNKLLIAYVLTKMNEIEIIEQLNKKLNAKLPSYMIPTHIVVLQEFPKTPNGKIDHKALPVSEYKVLKKVKSWSDHARTNIEFKLIQIWQELLGCESIGVKDNFFKLGGHSLLGIRLLAKIKSMFDKDISFLVLLENPTIADLALKINQDALLSDHKVWSPLVAIQPKGDYPPLFCVHPAGGTVFCYLDLATQLEKKRQPLFGLQAQGLEDHQTLLKTNEEMAASYLQAIRKIQTQGPYFLLGWSAGGMIAYEIAQQLYKSGEKVAFLGILDTYAYSVKNSRISALVLDDDIELLARLYIKENPYAELPSDLIKILKQLKPQQQLTYIVKQAKILGKLPCDISDKQAERLVQAFKHDCMLVRNYKPTPYLGKITVFRPVEALIMEKEKSNDLDWGFLTKQELEIYETPGNHFNMLFYPNVKILAATIWGCLKKYHLSGDKTEVAIF